MASRKKLTKKSPNPNAALKGARESLGLTLSQFSGQLGIDRQTLHRYESGHLSTPASLMASVTTLILTHPEHDHVAVSLAKQMGSDMGVAAEWLLLAAIGNESGADITDPKAVSRAARRAAELLKEAE